MVRLSFSAVSRIGRLSPENDDRVYASGRFKGPREMENTQLSFEGSDRQFLFAVSDGMENRNEEGTPEISVLDELAKFQKKTGSSIKDIQYKLEELTGCVEQVTNLLYSLTIGNESKKGQKAALAGILIDGDRAAAVNIGTCRAYKLDAENLRPLANDTKRTERLLKMGIITDEQAEQLSNQLSAPKSESLSQVRKSDTFKLKEDDVLLICSNGLLEVVNEDVIYEILSGDGDSDELADLLVREAIKNGAKDNVTAAVIKILSVGEEEAPVRSSAPSISGRLNRLAGTVGKKKMNTAKLVSTVVTFVVIAAVLFGTYSLIVSLTSHGKDASSQSGGDSTAVAGGTEGSDPTGETSETGDGTTGGAIQGTDVQGSDVAGSGDGEDVSGAETKYVVKKGDSLFLISKKFYGDSKKYTLIMEANKIKDPNKIAVGQELIIPAAD